MQVLRGLQSLHAKNLVHQDLKPDNVLLFKGQATTCRWLVKLADFGLTTLIDDQDGSTNMIRRGVAGGTRGYMSSEQAARLADVEEGKPTNDPSAGFDLWAFGLVLAKLLPGPVRKCAGDYVAQKITVNLSSSCHLWCCIVLFIVPACWTAL